MKKFDLRKWRRAQPFTQEELANMMGVSIDTIQRIENGDLDKKVGNAETWVYRYENDRKFHK